MIIGGVHDDCVVSGLPFLLPVKCHFWIVDKKKWPLVPVDAASCAQQTKANQPVPNLRYYV